MKSQWIGVLVLLLAVAGTVGCSSDSDSNSSGGEGLKACNAYCDASVAASCPDAADCKTDECADLGSTTGACDAAFKSYYDCLKAQANVCSTGTCQLDLGKCS